MKSITLFSQKTVLTLALMLMTTAGAWAQTTIESARKISLEIPSVKEMTAVATDLYDIAARQNDVKKAFGYIDRSYVAVSDASAKLRELQNTRERENDKLNRPIEERKAAELKNETDKTLKGTFGKSLEEFSDMNEDEMEATIGAGIKNMTGMSMEQILALEGKSEEEIKAAMKKSGTAQRVASNKGVIEQQAQYGAKGKQIADATQRVIALTNEATQIRMNVEAERDRLEKDLENMRAKHKAMLNQSQYSKIVALVPIATYGGGLVSPQEEQRILAAQKELIPLLDAYYEKTLSEWRTLLISQIGTVRKQEAALKRIEALNIEILEVQGYKNTAAVPQGLESEWEIAHECLIIARKFDDFFNPSKLK